MIENCWRILATSTFKTDLFMVIESETDVKEWLIRAKLDIKQQVKEDKISNQYSKGINWSKNVKTIIL